MPIDLECALAAAPISLAHAWEHTVGSGRALLALRADWREHLNRATSISVSAMCASTACLTTTWGR